MIVSRPRTTGRGLLPRPAVDVPETAPVFPPELLALVVTVVLLAGILTGVAGFGLALVATMALATVLPPATAVVVMIVPVLAANLSLLSDLDRGSVERCGRRFGPYIGAALVGTLAGTALLDRLPDRPLTLGLGLVTLAFVVSAQGAIDLPGLDRLRDRCFVESRGGMLVLGGVSGLLFGATNVGVQVVAYVRSRGLSHGLFVGVIAMVFVGINTVRAGLAAVLGLYPDTPTLVLSIVLAAPAIVGVAAGKRLRPRVPEGYREPLVLSLLALIGLRLLAGGLGIG